MGGKGERGGMSDYDIRSKIGLRIKELRAERGVSQEEFANLIGMSRSYFGEVGDRQAQRGSGQPGEDSQRPRRVAGGVFRLGVLWGEVGFSRAQQSNHRAASQTSRKPPRNEIITFSLT